MKMKITKGILGLRCLWKNKGNTIYCMFFSFVIYFRMLFVLKQFPTGVKRGRLENKKGQANSWTVHKHGLDSKGPKLIFSARFCKNVRIPYNFLNVVDWGVLGCCCPARNPGAVWLTAVNSALSPGWTTDRVWLWAENPTMSCHSS